MCCVGWTCIPHIWNIFAAVAAVISFQVGCVLPAFDASEVGKIIPDVSVQVDPSIESRAGQYQQLTRGQQSLGYHKTHGPDGL